MRSPTAWWRWSADARPLREHAARVGAGCARRPILRQGRASRSRGAALHGAARSGPDRSQTARDRGQLPTPRTITASHRSSAEHWLAAGTTQQSSECSLRWIVRRGRDAHPAQQWRAVAWKDLVPVGERRSPSTSTRSPYGIMLSRGQGGDYREHAHCRHRLSGASNGGTRLPSTSGGEAWPVSRARGHHRQALEQFGAGLSSAKDRATGCALARMISEGETP